MEPVPAITTTPERGDEGRGTREERGVRPVDRLVAFSTSLVPLLSTLFPRKAASHAASTSDTTTICFANPQSARATACRLAFFQTPRDPTAKPLRSPPNRLRIFRRKSGSSCTVGDEALKLHTRRPFRSRPTPRIQVPPL